MLLVCNSCGSNVSSKTRESALNWCLQHHFELIELNPIRNSTPTNAEDLEDDEIIPEKVGVDRVIEALHTHHWANATMKGRSLYYFKIIFFVIKHNFQTHVISWLKPIWLLLNITQKSE